MQRNQIIQVGAGGWGFSWLDIVQASPHWQLAAVVDRDPATVQRALQRTGLAAGALWRRRQRRWMPLQR
jgi:predicted dehydrogenase